jgi:hypothetical protein
MLDEKGNVRTVTFTYGAASNAEGGTVFKSFNVPLLAILTHPVIGVKETKVTFSLEARENTSIESTSTKTTDGQIAVISSQGSASYKYNLSRSEDRKRSTETTASIKIEATLDRIPTPEALEKVISALLA